MASFILTSNHFLPHNFQHEEKLSGCRAEDVLNQQKVLLYSTEFFFMLKVVRKEVIPSIQKKRNIHTNLEKGKPKETQTVWTSLWKPSRVLKSWWRRTMARLATRRPLALPSPSCRTTVWPCTDARMQNDRWCRIMLIAESCASQLVLLNLSVESEL